MIGHWEYQSLQIHEIKMHVPELSEFTAVSVERGCDMISSLDKFPHFFRPEKQVDIFAYPVSAKDPRCCDHAR